MSMAMGGVCSVCSAPLEVGAAFCASCGRPTAPAAGPAGGLHGGIPLGMQGGMPVGVPADPGAPMAPPPASAPYQPAIGARYVDDHRKGKVAKASKMLLVLSVLFVIGGTIFGFMNKSEADKARDQIAQLDPSQTLVVEGKTYTLPELQKEIDREVMMVFVINYFLAVVMFGLFLWSRKAALPAMVTGLCVYIAVIVLSAAIEPKSLAQGVLIKIIAIVVLVSGIKAALQERDERAGGART